MLSSRLALRTFQQTLKTSELKVLMLSLILAVAVMSGIGLFIEVLKGSLLAGSSELLGGDRQLHSSREIDPEWINKAASMNLQSAKGVSFPTMLVNGDDMSLVSVRAVDAGFPLRGEIETATPAIVEPGLSEETGFSENVEYSYQIEPSGPAAGKLWLSERLFTLLNLNIGDKVSLGAAEFIAEKILVREPDVRFGMSALSPRVMMNAADIARSQVIQPGSRISYTWYFVGDEQALTDYHNWLSPQMERWHRWRSVKEGRPSVSNALDKAETYLYLAGGLSMLLAMAAIQLSSRQFALSQIKHVGLLRAMGLRRKAILAMYLQLMSGIGIVGAILGCIAGAFVFWLGYILVADVFKLQTLVAVSHLEFVFAMLKGIVTAIACVYVACMPLFKQLGNISPMVILRSDSLQGKHTGKWEMLPGVVVMAFILAWFTRDAALTGALFLALALLYVLISLIVVLGIRLLKSVVRKADKTRPLMTAMSIAVNRLDKHRWQSAFQIFSFGLTLMVLITLVLVRTELLDEWRAQLPENAPNHFLINIAEYDVEGLRHSLAKEDVAFGGIYPMVRGRLTHINGESVKTAVTKEKDIGALNRELNLSWSDHVLEGNSLASGKWWDEFAAGECHDCVSVESRLAERLGLALGDRLTFTIGSVPVDVKISSFRKVAWDSMRPNFYMLFHTETLKSFPATYITSFYLPEGKKTLLNQLAINFPTVSILEVDVIIKRIEEIMANVSMAIEMLLALVIIASLLVMLALINASIGERKQQVAILRALGANKRIVVNTQWSEFSLLGFAAAFVAYLGAEVTVNLVLKILFESSFSLHFLNGVPIAIGGMALIALLGTRQVKPVLQTSPTVVLREV